MTSSLKKLSLIVAGLFFFFTLLFSLKSLPVDIKIPDFFFLQKPSFHNLATMKSNQWYSSIYTFPSQPLYAFPLAFRLTERGLGFSYPDVVSQPNTVFASYNEDFVVGLAKPFVKNSLDSVSDWSFVTSLKTETNDTISFSLGHGIPFTTINATEKNLTLSSIDPLIVYPNNQAASSSEPTIGNEFVISIRNHNYIIVFPKGALIKQTPNSIASNSNKVFVALLDKRENYQKFLAIANTEIQSTSLDFKVQDETLVTTYSLQTNTNKSLIALFPHQADFLVSKPQVLGLYKTLRGTMQLIAANHFVTKMPLQIPVITFNPINPSQTILIAQIKRDTEKVLAEKPTASQDYYLGVYFGKVATLIQLAEVAGLSDEKERLIAHLKPLFLNSMDYFAYDKTQTSLIAKKSEFGNDNLNDHHFHYGYYIRTAAILGQEDPTFLKLVTPQITEMVKDIANADRSSTKYPFLRNFDIYEGHSWAAGYANFTDGNNQESSSEALNAWYGLYLWGKTTNNSQLQNDALYLFNTELLSTRYYWFNEKNIYQPPFDHAIASIVWGGKVDFATWFSAQTNMIYGIQLLPFTPASTYLQNMTPYGRYEEDFLKHGGSFSSDWGELMLMWKALGEPLNASLFTPRTTNIYEGTLPSTYLYFLSLNK